MAQPVIREIVAPATAAAGQQFTVTIDAYDPDARSLTFTATASDGQGGTATAITTVSIADPLTYALTSDDPAAAIAQDPADPSRFTVTA